MMNLRKLTALALAGALSLSLLTACGPKENAPTGTPAPEVTDTVPPTTEPTVEPTAEPTEKPIDEPIAVDPTAEPTKAPVATPKPTEKPAATPTPAPTEAPQTSKVQAIWSEISALPMPKGMAELDADTLNAVYGIDAGDLEEYICMMPMVNVQATEFFLAKVKDGKLAAVKAAVEARQAALAEEWAMYLPEQLELVENYKLVTSGNYILFAISESASDAVDLFNAHTK